MRDAAREGRARAVVGVRTRALAGALAALRRRRRRRLGDRRRRRAVLAAIARRLGYEVGAGRPGRASRGGRSVFLTSQFAPLGRRWLDSTHRLGVAYLHGRPGTPGHPEFDACFEALRGGTRAVRADPGDARRDGGARRLGRRRAGEVFRIPIGIDLERFRSPTPTRARGARGARPARRRVRRRLVPEGRRRLGRGLEPKLDQGPGRPRRRRGAAPRARARSSSSCSPGPRAATCGASSSGAESPYGHLRVATGRSSRTRLPRARRVPRHVAAGGRPEGRARVDGDRRAARDDARRAGGGSRRARRERRCSPTSTTRRRSAGARPTVHGRRDAARRSLRGRGRADAERTSHGAPRRRAGPSCSTGSSSSGRWTLAERAAATAGGGALGASPRRARRARAPGFASSTATTASPAPGEPVAGGTAKFQKLAARFPNRPADFTLLYLGSTALPRDLRPLLWLARRRRAPVVVNQDGVAYPGWAGARHRGRQRASPPGAPRRPTTSSTRARSASARPTASSASRAGRWEILHNAVDVDRFTPAAAPPAGGPVLLLGGDQTPAVPARARARDAPARAAGAPEDARLLVARPARSPTRAAISELGSTAASSSSAATRSAMRPRSIAARTSSCTRRSTTPARTSCSRRWRAGSRSSTRRAAARSSSSATRRESAFPTRTSWERDAAAGRRRRWPTPSSACSRTRERYAAAARRRAVERFALGPWLDRHAALFAELLRGDG